MRIQSYLIKFPSGPPVQIDKLVKKFIKKCEETSIAKTTVKIRWRNTVGRSMLINFKTYTVKLHYQDNVVLALAYTKKKKKEN